MPIPHVSRRTFLGALLAPALAMPGPSRAADRPKVVGYLSGGQGPEWLVKVLAERGYVEGKNLRVETRIPPDWEVATLAKAAAELVALRPDVLYALHANRVGALAGATRTIPIVCGGAPDPVGAGFAKTLRRPGGNITGLSFGLPETADITIGLLKAMRPGLKRLGGFIPPGLNPAGSWWAEAGRKAGVEWLAVTVAPDLDIERAMSAFAGQAVVVAPTKDPERGSRILAVATRMRVMTMGRTTDGAMMDYGLDFENMNARVAAILDQVLRGANPAEIPFELPDRPSFSLNRKTARAIGIEVPADILLRTTEIID